MVKSGFSVAILIVLSGLVYAEEERMTQPRYNTTQETLIDLYYEGPALQVNREIIMRAAEARKKGYRESFEVGLTEDCFIRSVKKFSDGRVQWVDAYK